MSKKRKTKDATEILNRHFGNDPARRSDIEQMKQDMEIGSLIYAARTEAGLTQTDLAQRIGTQQSVISALEAADYDGHSMPMLRRIAEALGLSIEVKFVEHRSLEHA